MSVKAKSVRQLAAALGRGKSSVAEFAHERWFPARGPEGWDVAEVALALRRNVNLRVELPATPFPIPAPKRQPSPPRQAEERAAGREPTIYAWPSRSACPHCQSLATRRTSARGPRQYRRCTDCRRAYQVAGVPVAGPGCSPPPESAGQLPD